MKEEQRRITPNEDSVILFVIGFLEQQIEVVLVAGFH